MNDFVSIEVLGTMAGCSLIITLLTQVFKKYLPEKIDTKWLALAFSVVVGVLRIFYINQFDFAGITSGILIGNPVTTNVMKIVEGGKHKKGGKNNG